MIKTKRFIWCTLAVAASLLEGTPAFGALTVTSQSPTNGANGVCTDTLLRITFNEPPKLGSSGVIRIFNSSDDSTPVDVIDLAAGNLRPRVFPGDAQAFNEYSVLISGNTATIYPHDGVLTTSQGYYVIVEPDVFRDAGGIGFDGITDTNAWHFTTRLFGPADPTNLVVAADGSGDFRTVQGAVDFVPGGNVIPTMIDIRDGDYVGLVNISGKHNVLFRGQSREGTIVGYANNANIAPNGTTHARMAFKVNADDIAIDNLTITNRTPQGGSQAEALMIETGIKRFVANNAKIASYQDTILANTSGTQGYFKNCLVQGDVDFIWGGGNLFFTNCEIKTLRSNSDVVQPRTDQGSNGMSFVQCRFTRSSPNINGCLFARSLGYRFSSVAIIDCLIDSHITGWETTYLIGFGTKNPNLRWWEHGNSNLSATASVEYQGHQIGLTNNDPRLEFARSATNWLYGWQPLLLPNIITQPSDRTATAGETVDFSVVATGIPDPTYKWRKDGTNLVGETASALSIGNVQAGDEGDYSVVVFNAAGTVTSRVAALVVEPEPPTISNPMILGGGTVQFSFNGPSGQPYRVWASTNAALSPVTENWTELTNGMFGSGSVLFIDPEVPLFPQRFFIITVP